MKRVVSRRSRSVQTKSTSVSILSVMTLLVMVLIEYSPVLGDETHPSPLALLRGVESARNELHTGQIEMSIKLEKVANRPNWGKDNIRLVFRFDGEKRCCDHFQRILVIDGSDSSRGKERSRKLQGMSHDRAAFVKQGLGTWNDVHMRSIYDGEQLMQFSKLTGGTIKDPIKGALYFAFDPRIIGLTGRLGLDLSIRKTIPIQDSKKIELIGQEEIAGKATWHVFLIDSYDQERHYWIEATAGFPIHRFEYRSKYNRMTADSEYLDSSTGSVLPSRVVMRIFKNKNELMQESILEVTDVKYGIPIDPQTWTLAGLEMPRLTHVIDERIRRGIGHWDGEKLVDLAIKTQSLNKENNDVSRLEIILFNLAALVSICGFILFRRTRKKNRVRISREN